eukprot:scaffold1428_cov259-Pinguiococcus_pyrenoidosus.AAC.12
MAMALQRIRAKFLVLKMITGLPLVAASPASAEAMQGGDEAVCGVKRGHAYVQTNPVSHPMVGASQSPLELAKRETKGRKKQALHRIVPYCPQPPPPPPPYPCPCAAPGPCPWPRAWPGAGPGTPAPMRPGACPGMAPRGGMPYPCCMCGGIMPAPPRGPPIMGGLGGIPPP